MLKKLEFKVGEQLRQEKKEVIIVARVVISVH